MNDVAQRTVAMGVGVCLGWWALTQFWNRPIPPHGGAAFDRILPVRHFAQGDPRWAADPMGPTGEPLGPTGCAVASAAMALAYYGADTDPGRLNAFLNERGGFTPQSWLYWEAAAGLMEGAVFHAYEGPPSHHLIDRNLAQNNPVIAKVRLPGRGTTHFVVICGKAGTDYLIQDPGQAGAGRGPFPLRELGSPIEGVRYYVRRAIR